MPEIDGTEVISAVARYRPSTPVVAISGGGSYLTREFSIKIAKSVRSMVMLAKPFQLDELLRAVENALNRGSSAAQAGDPG